MILFNLILIRSFCSTNSIKDDDYLNQVLVGVVLSDGSLVKKIR
jgi:hypothetical protein